MTVQEAARMLGVSKGMVYGLAAPAGPIPCARIGSRIIFDQVDIVEFKQKCRYTEVKHAVGISLNLTAMSVGGESGLLKRFQKLGIKPRLTHSTGENFLKLTRPCCRRHPTKNHVTA